METLGAICNEAKEKHFHCLAQNGLENLLLNDIIRIVAEYYLKEVLLPSSVFCIAVQERKQKRKQKMTFVKYNVVSGDLILWHAAMPCTAIHKYWSARLPFVRNCREPQQVDQLEILINDGKQWRTVIRIKDTSVERDNHNDNEPILYVKVHLR